MERSQKCYNRSVGARARPLDSHWGPQPPAPVLFIPSTVSKPGGATTKCPCNEKFRDELSGDEMFWNEMSGYAKGIRAFDILFRSVKYFWSRDSEVYWSGQNRWRLSAHDLKNCS